MGYPNAAIGSTHIFEGINHCILKG